MSNKTIGGTNSDDVIVLSDNTNYLINSGAGNDIIMGGSGNDTINGGPGNDYLCGGDGNDLVYANNSGSYADSHDTLNGGIGNDTLVGAGGNDAIVGGNGDDLIHGGEGVDTLTGGAGRDIFNFNSLDFTPTHMMVSGKLILNASSDKITDFTEGQDKIVLDVGVVHKFTDLQIAVQGNDTHVKFDVPAYHSADGAERTMDLTLTGVHHLTANDFVFDVGLM